MSSSPTTPPPSATPTSTAAPTPTNAEPAAPVNGKYALRIPQLGVNAPVIAVKAKNRRLDPPRDPQIVGWWSEGAAPGDDIGSAVIVGHTVSTGGGVFDDVDRLKRGATVEVAGSTNRWAYRVDSVEVLSKGEFARQAERIFNQSIAGRLVLITCEDWDGEVYRSNVVAIARPV